MLIFQFQFQGGGIFIPWPGESDGSIFRERSAYPTKSLHRNDGKLSPLFVFSMDDRGGRLLFGEQSLTRFPHSRPNIYENVSSLSSLSYLPPLQILPIPAYSKFSNRHLRLQRARSLLPIAVLCHSFFYTYERRFVQPTHRIPSFARESFQTSNSKLPNALVLTLNLSTFRVYLFLP